MTVNTPIDHRPAELERSTLDNVLTWGALVIVLGLALFMRVHSIREAGAASHDEIWHILLSTGRGSFDRVYPENQFTNNLAPLTSTVGAPPIWKVWTSLDEVLHPPLYVTTLRAWRIFFGDSEEVAAYYSVTWGLVGMAFLFFAAKQSFGAIPAVLSGLIVAVAATPVYLHTEVRGYAMLSGLSAILLWLLLRIDLIGTTRRRTTMVGVIALLMMLTHYFAAGALLGVFVWGIVRLTKRDRNFWLATFFGVAIVYLIVWGPFFYRQLAFVSTGDAFLQLPRDQVLIRIFGNMTTYPLRAIVEPMDQTPLLKTMVGVVLALWLVSAIWVPAIRVWVLIVMSTLLFLALMDVARSTHHLSFIRYSAVAAVPMIISLVGIWSVVTAKLPTKFLKEYAPLTLPACMFILAVINYQARYDGDSPRFAPVTFAIFQGIPSSRPIVFSAAQKPAWQAAAALFDANHRGLTQTYACLWTSGPITPELLGDRRHEPFVAASFLTGMTPAELAPGAIVLRELVNPNRAATPLWELQFPK